MVLVFGWLNSNADAPLSMTIGNWYHVVYSGNNTSYAIYTDGALTGSGTYDSLSLDNLLAYEGGSMRIGHTGFGSEYFEGQIDNVRIYNKAVHAE